MQRKDVARENQIPNIVSRRTVGAYVCVQGIFFAWACDPVSESRSTFVGYASRYIVLRGERASLTPARLAINTSQGKRLVRHDFDLQDLITCDI